MGWFTACKLTNQGPQLCAPAEWQVGCLQRCGSAAHLVAGLETEALLLPVAVQQPEAPAAAWPSLAAALLASLAAAGAQAAVRLAAAAQRLPQAPALAVTAVAAAAARFGQGLHHLRNSSGRVKSQCCTLVDMNCLLTHATCQRSSTLLTWTKHHNLRLACRQHRSCWLLTWQEARLHWLELLRWACTETHHSQPDILSPNSNKQS